MKYKKQLFDYAVKDYMRSLEELRYRSVLIIFDLNNQKALLSLAPLSQALHELHADVYVISRHGGVCIEFDALQRLWRAYEDYVSHKRSKDAAAFNSFMQAVSRKAGDRFEKLFRLPAVILESGKEGFACRKIELPYKYKWFKPYKALLLQAASKKIWKSVFALKKKEVVQIDLPLVPPENILKLPLEDYLDSYAIVWTLSKAAQSIGAFPLVKGITARVSPMEPAEHIFDMLLALYGCEHCKKIPEPIFKEYLNFSKYFKLDALVPPQARLRIATQGFNGRHLFGEMVGYPTPDRKSRWDEPFSMFMKQCDDVQSYADDRKPATRVALTETLPIDVFVETTNIDYVQLRKRTRRLKELLVGCLLINVVSSNENKQYATNLIIDVGHRNLYPDDSDVTTMADPDWLKKKKHFGRYTNIPGGEVFMTPQSMQGTFVGDVVMHVDRSVVLSPKDPLVVNVEDGKYQIIRAPKHIAQEMEVVKQEHLKVLYEKEKHRSLPQPLVDSMKDNFNRIGEFAINTHPTAKVCDYLVVNEKIARMMHIALGTGFETDRQSVYHFDIVIDAAKQKLDVYGVKSDGTEVWVLKNGRMVF